MNQPTPQDARRRMAQVEARLRGATPVWSSGQRSLFLSDDGYYVLEDRSPSAVTRYVGIAPDGMVIDLSGYPVDGGDIEAALQALASAGLTQVKQRVIDWPLRR